MIMLSTYRNAPFLQPEITSTFDKTACLAHEAENLTDMALSEKIKYKTIIKITFILLILVSTQITAITQRVNVM